MLLSFQVTNHRSIRDEQTLHLEPVYDRTRPALPVAAIFGANAAGKSNVLDAFAFMVTAVRESLGAWREGVPYQPFRLEGDRSSAESVYLVELLLDGIRWTYGFAIDANSVRAEWLHCYPQKRRRIIFQRESGSVTTGSTSGLDQTFLSAITKFLDRTLVMSIAAASATSGEAGAGIFGDALPVVRWFLDAVDLPPTDVGPLDEAAIIERLETASDRDSLVGLIVAADVGIVDIEVDHLVPLSPSDDSEAKATDVGSVEKRLFFLHGPNRVRMSLADESRGTRVWLGYLGPVLDSINSGSLLVVDEIDTSLHPHLTAQLIRLVRDRDLNRHGAQLIFTTHDATLLGKNFGDSILGRDEVWFVEKTPDQATGLFSLADFKARKDDNIERRYLTGSYGAIPQPADSLFDDAIRGHTA